MNVRRHTWLLFCMSMILVWNLGLHVVAAQDITRAERMERLENASRFILEQQDEHGAMIESGYINTDSNMLYALMGLISAHDLTRKPQYLRAVERGMAWLMRVQTPQGDWHLSYRRVGEGYLPAIPGSYRKFAAIRGVDTTMALFIHVAREVDRRTENQSLRKQMRAAARRAYQFLVWNNLDHKDGLFWSSYQLERGEIARSLADYRLYKVKYAADNAETYLGLIAAAALFPDTPAQKQAERLKRNFDRFFDRKQGVYSVMLDGQGEMSMRPAYARWFANGWSACLMRDQALFALPLAIMASQMDQQGAFPQREGTYTLSTLAFLLGEQAYPISSKRGEEAERFLFARQNATGGLDDSKEESSTYVNLAGIFILYLSRELEK